MNQELILYPYMATRGDQRGLWVFDDSRTRILNEPFVSGMTEMISQLVCYKNLNQPEKGFKLVFSASPMENQDAILTWMESNNPQLTPGVIGSADAGNWYEGKIGETIMKGWLCPALGCYFKTAPEKIYIRVENLPNGINPIWQPGPGEYTRCFVTGEKLRSSGLHAN